MKAKERRMMDRKTSRSEMKADDYSSHVQEKQPGESLGQEILRLEKYISDLTESGMKIPEVDLKKLSQLKAKKEKRDTNLAAQDAIVRAKQESEQAKIQVELEAKLKILEGAINWSALNEDYWEIQNIQEAFESLIMTSADEESQPSKDGAIKLLDKFFINKQEATEIIESLNPKDLADFFKEKYGEAYKNYMEASTKAA